MRRALLLALLCACGCRGPQPQGELTFLSVGQGDCTIFRDGPYTVLIDAGPKTDIVDAGERLVLPALRKMGVREIDLLIITHPDTDHIGGLPTIAKKFPIGKVIVADHFRHHPELVKILRDASLPTAKVEFLGQATETRLGDFTLHMDRPSWKSTLSDNDGSLFAWIGNGKSSAVLTGDASIETEAMMIRRRSWKAQIARIGHHGSYTSTSDAWIEHVDPQTAIISCGRDNSYGHPHQQILDRLEKHKVKTLRTDRDGTLRFKATPDGFKLERYP